MVRPLDENTLNGYAKAYASWWLAGRHPARALAPKGREGLAEEFYNLVYKDEFNYLIDAIRDNLGGAEKEAFDVMADGLRAREARTDEVFHSELRARMAVDRDGNHIGGTKGRCEVGRRIIGKAPFQVEKLWSVRRRKELGLPIHDPKRTDRYLETRLCRVAWPIYFGEEEERGAIEAGERKFIQEGLDVIDPIPMPDLVMMAANMTISNVVALASCDAVVDGLDVGTGPANVRGRTGAQPTLVDDTETGTLLFTCVCSDPAFGAAADQAPGARATASAITADSSADATGTVGYCRGAATGTGADDVIDGNAGTSAADFVFNSTAITAGAQVDITSWTVDQSES